MRWGRFLAAPLLLLLPLLLLPPLLLPPLLLPRDSGVDPEGVTAFAEERDHLAGQGRAPAAPELIVAEPMAATRAGREREPGATVGAVEQCECTSSALDFVPGGTIERHLRDRFVEELALGPVGGVVDDLAEVTG